MTDKLTDLKFDQQNPRRHDERNLKVIGESLKATGPARSIVIDEDDNILAGNGVTEAARAAGIERVIVVEAEDDALIAVRKRGLTPEQKTALKYYDNRSAELAEWEPERILADLNMGLDMGQFWNEGELNALLAGLDTKQKEDAGPQVDKAAELAAKWGTQTGQVWALGEHRLVVGDCTDKAVVEAVMRGERGRMIFTDPPYGIGKDIENDNLKREAKVEFYRQWTNVALDYIIENAYVYVWGYFDTLSDYWQEVVKPRKDCNFRNFIIWKKTFIQGRNAKEFRQFPEHYEACLLFIFGQPFQNGPWSTSPNAEYYPEMFEPLRSYLDGERQKMGWDIPTVKKLVGHSDLSGDHWFNKSQWSMPTQEVYEVLRKKAGGNAFRREYDDLRGYFDNTNGFTDLWQFDKVTTVDSHPTVKPVEVCERGIMTTSQAGEIVLDCFLGSGTTLIACENLKRKCRAIEIDPGYSAVAIERWHTLTGQKPALLD
jgi:DNA modification methylase